MKLTDLNLSQLVKTALPRLLLLCALVGQVSHLSAKGSSGVVAYTPQTQTVEGNMPFSVSYPVTVTAPSNFPAATSSVIGFTVTPSTFAVGDAATAASYVSFSPSTLTFTAPGQVLTTTVTITFPVLTLTGGLTSAAFAYDIFTTGWPLTLGVDYFDNGTHVNAVASVAGSVTPIPPTVVIGTPVDGSTISYTPAQFPATIPVTFTSTGTTTYPVLSVDANVDGTALVVSSTGLGTASVSSTSSLVVTGPGTHSVTANAFGPGGSASDTNVFTVTVNAPPPVASISLPNGPTYTVRAQGPAATVPVTFQGVSSYNGIRSFTVVLDNAPFAAYTTTAFGQLTVTGNASLSYSAAGTHTMTVTAFDDVGTSNTASTTFTVNYVAPTPTVAVSLDNGTTYTIPTGGTSIASIPFTIASTSNNGFNVDAVAASSGSTTLTIASNTPALGTAAAITSKGTLTNVTPGSYTITATATSAGVLVSNSATFTVNAAVQQPLPTVVINTPAVGSTYTLVAGGSPLSIPLTFTGTSNATNGVITALSAKVDTTTLSVTPTNLNQKVANGAATMTITTAGTHTISVGAVDAYGSASATRTFTVTVVQGRSICGRIFFDCNYNGVWDCTTDSRTCGTGWDDNRGSCTDRYWDTGSCNDYGDRSYSRYTESCSSYSNNYYQCSTGCADFGLGGVTVSLLNSSGVVIATQVSSASGDYCFTGIAPGCYTVSAVAPVGYGSTTQTTRAVTVANCNVSVRDIGFGLKHTDIANQCASGKPSTYWKTQFSKACNNDRSAEVSSTTCNNYTKTIGTSLCLDVFDGISIKSCSSTLSSTSTRSSDQLCRELLAAEVNYSNGAYINGNKTLTYCFIQWGENVMKNRSAYSDTYTKWAANWFTAYNCSQGGKVAGPTN